MDTSPETRAVLEGAQRIAEQIAAARFADLGQHDREDLVAEVVLKYFRTFGRDQRPVNPSAWIATALRTTAIDRARSARSRLVDLVPQHDERLGPNEFGQLFGRHPSEVSSKVVSTKLIAAVLALVSDTDATLIRLRFIEGYSAAEVAAQQDRTVDAIHQASSRARRRLLKALDARQDLVHALRSGLTE